MLLALFGLFGGGFALTYACAKEECAPALPGMPISVVNTGLFPGAAIMRLLFRLGAGAGAGMVPCAKACGCTASPIITDVLLMVAFAVVTLMDALRITETGGCNITEAGNTREHMQVEKS